MPIQIAEDDARGIEMAAYELGFGGRRFGAVRIPHDDTGERPWIVFNYEVVGGHGQVWEADRPRAFWRSFASIRLGGSAAGVAEVLSFIRRHGDPLGKLDQGLRGSTGEWLPLIETLNGIAQAWDPPGPDGTSRFSADPGRQKLARGALEHLAPPDKGVSETVLVAQDDRLVVKCLTLRSFMVLSAAHALQHRIDMKQCRWTGCGDWFEPRRTDALFCSGSCQARHSKQRAIDAALGAATV
jgi:hypothetical protein